MPTIDADGCALYYEEAGSGPAVVFVHEMAGDCASWEPQLRALARRYRCIAFNARGYPPSEVPEEPAAYSQRRAAEDLRAVLDGLDIERAHVVGLSMGAFATLHFGLLHPERACSLVVAGCGHGSAREDAEQFRSDVLRMAERIEGEGLGRVAADYAEAPSRVQLEAKDPRGWAWWRDRFAAHSPEGTVRTLRQIQAQRPSLLELGEGLARLPCPVLLVAGDEDDPALAVSLWLKRTIPGAGLAILPRTGHAVNLEEPEWFNALLRDFLWRVEGGAWGPRDPRSRARSTMFQEP